MALQDLLRELVETRGTGVVADADQFRGALDDFLSEHEASRGEINLLVDAVRLGAVTRVVAMLDHGAEAGAALDEVAVELARDRGADSATGARWALGAIGFALGKVDASQLTSDRPSSLPAPPVAPVAPVAPPSGAPRLDPRRDPLEGTQPTPPPEPREPAPPTNRVDGPPPSGHPEHPGTMTMPEHATERVPDAGPPGPAGPVAGPPPSRPFFAGPPRVEPARKGRGRLVAVLVALLLVVGGGVAGAVLLTSGDDPERATDRTSGESSESPEPSPDAGSTSPDDGASSPVDDPPPATLPASQVVLPITVDGNTGIYVLDLEEQTTDPLTTGTNDRLPSISPDRSTIVFLRSEVRGSGLRSPYVLDVATQEERPLFDEDSPCLYTGRAAWSPSGDKLAVPCYEEGEDGPVYAGSYAVGLDGQEQLELELDGVPDGGLTWDSDSTLIYARASDTPGGPTQLWSYSTGDAVSAPLPGMEVDAGFDSHPDWSDENGVALFQRSTSSGADVRGELWTWSPYEGVHRLDIGQPVAHGAFSADGSMVLFVIDTEEGERLASAPYDDPSEVTDYDELPGEPGAPAGGSL